jgi:hypothetical protein
MPISPNKNKKRNFVSIYVIIIIMTTKIKEKEYKNLLELKRKLDEILKNVFIEKRKQITACDLLDLTRLKIKGGPKDLSQKARFYIYSRK